MPPLRLFSHYVPGRNLLLVLGDVVILSTSVLVWDWMRPIGFQPIWIGDPPILPKVSAFVLLGIFTFYVAGLYDFSPHLGRKELAVRVMGAASIWAVLFAAVAFSIPTLRLGRLASFLAFGISTFALMSLRWLLSLQSSHSGFRERLLFLGATPLAERLIKALEANNPGYEILGYVDDHHADTVSKNNGFDILGTTSELPQIVSRTKAGTIVVALAERRGTFPAEAILECKLSGVRIEDWPAFYEKLTRKIVVHDLRPSWLVFSEGFNRNRVTRVIKRLIDLSLSVFFLALGWPLFLFLGIAIKLDSRGPIFFRQKRVGERGRVFTLFKFRTMVDNAEGLTGPIWASEEDRRITPVGRWLRKSRLDEFPQLINVFKGEMSFIGPRPERPHFVEKLQVKIPYYAQRHTIKPGITGWAQVRYRYGATIEDAEEKLQYDLYYVKNMSIFLDLLILLSSIQVVLFGKGAR